MNPEASWDDPALFYDSQVFWDETYTTTPNHMNNTYKVLVSYNNRTNPQLAVIAQAVKDSLTEKALMFPNPPVTMADFQTQITDFSAKLTARQTSRSIQDVSALQLARDGLLASLRSLANFVNAVAEGRLEYVSVSGYPFYDTRRAPRPNPPDAPANLRLSRGTGSGMIIARFTPALSPAASEVQVNLGDPNNEAQWEERGTYYNGRVSLSGFAPGIVVWVRARTVGRGGSLSPWSASADIRTL